MTNSNIIFIRKTLNQRNIYRDFQLVWLIDIARRWGTSPLHQGPVVLSYGAGV